MAGIKIKKKNEGLFTRKAKNHNMGVQEFAREVLNHKDKYSTKTKQEAAFAKNIGGRAKDGATLQQLDQYGRPILDTSIAQTYTPPPTLIPNTQLTQGPANWVSQQPQQQVQPVAPVDTTKIIQGVSNLSQALGGIQGQGGNTLGNTISAVAPVLSAIPGVGALASPIAGAVGGIINMFGHHKDYELPDIKIVRPTQSYNPYPQGTGSSILKNGGSAGKTSEKTITNLTFNEGDVVDLGPEDIKALIAAGYKFNAL